MDWHKPFKRRMSAFWERGGVTRRALAERTGAFSPGSWHPWMICASVDYFFIARAIIVPGSGASGSGASGRRTGGAWAGARTRWDGARPRGRAVTSVRGGLWLGRSVGGGGGEGGRGCTRWAALTQGWIGLALSVDVG